MPKYIEIPNDGIIRTPIYGNEGYTVTGFCMSDLSDVPAADVAPVVHCCQCKHDGECAIKLMIVSENGNNPYCSLGKRKDAANVHN